jgi:hypothetical protein
MALLYGFVQLTHSKLDSTKLSLDADQSAQLRRHDSLSHAESVSLPFPVVCVLCAPVRLAELDSVLQLLRKWLGTAEETWPAVQAAARAKQPALMRK